MRASWIALAVGLALAGSARAQKLEAMPAPAGQPLPVYLQPGEVRYGDIMGPPPAIGSLADRLDLEQVQELQTAAGPGRFAQAEEDARLLFPRFSEALGAPLDSAHYPRIIRLLTGAVRDAAEVSSAGKTAFARARPYQRVQLSRVCGAPTAPAPVDAPPQERTSYPSGHSTVGWTTALVLAEIAPDHGPTLLARARDYALSRIVCGVHYPSDVEAGRAAATAVVTRLNANPAFQHDLALARAEYQGAGR
jgi:acid phosphatase (class A)